MAHLVWTIVPMVILDRCCVSSTTIHIQILFKLFICTCPQLLSNELSIIFLSHKKLLLNEPLLICIKWLIFVAAIFISFWTGIVSEKKKWRGIHGEKIVPEHYCASYIIQT